jgi:hypothetical protein
MRRILAALAATAAVCTAVPAQAATYSFEFSFTNVANGGGLVTGGVGNLVDNTTSPGEVVVFSNSAGWGGVGPYNGNSGNEFTMVNGVITDFFYMALGDSNTNPVITCCSLFLGSGYGGGLSGDPQGVGIPLGTKVTFSTGNLAPVPLPAPFALLAAGLALLAAVGRRRPRAAA